MDSTSIITVLASLVPLDSFAYLVEHHQFNEIHRVVSKQSHHRDITLVLNDIRSTAHIQSKQHLTTQRTHKLSKHTIINRIGQFAPSIWLLGSNMSRLEIFSYRKILGPYPWMECYNSTKKHNKYCNIGSINQMIQLQRRNHSIYHVIILALLERLSRDCNKWKFDFTRQSNLHTPAMSYLTLYTQYTFMGMPTDISYLHCSIPNWLLGLIIRRGCNPWWAGRSMFLSRRLHCRFQIQENN